MANKRHFDFASNRPPARKVNIGKNLKALLKERDLKLTQVSRATGIPLQTLNNWLSNQSPRNLAQLHRLCSYLRVSIEQLVFGEDPPIDHSDLLTHVLDSEVYMGKFEVLLRRIKE